MDDLIAEQTLAVLAGRTFASLPQVEKTRVRGRALMALKRRHEAEFRQLLDVEAAGLFSSGEVRWWST